MDKKICTIPDFLISGFMKSGTTDMMRSLQKSKGIHIPKGEQNFFNRHFNQGSTFYAQKFQHGKLNGDKSPSYGTDDIYGPVSRMVTRIKNYCPNVKFIWMMRDPAERAFSHYCHGIRKKRRRVVDKYASISKMFGRKQKQPLILKEFLNDPRVLHRGNYYQILEEYLKEFNKEQMIFIISDHYIQNKISEYNRVRKFLGVKKMNDVKFDKFNKEKRKSTKVKSSHPTLLKKLKSYYTEEVENLSGLVEVDLIKLWNYDKI